MSRNAAPRLSIARVAVSLACLALAVFFAPGVHAQSTVAYVSQAQAQQKLSPDLLSALSAPSVAGLSWAKDTPEPRVVHPPELGSVIAIPQVGGLHHRYERRAA